MNPAKRLVTLIKNVKADCLWHAYLINQVLFIGTCSIDCWLFLNLCGLKTYFVGFPQGRKLESTLTMYYNYYYYNHCLITNWSTKSTECYRDVNLILCTIDPQNWTTGRTNSSQTDRHTDRHTHTHTESCTHTHTDTHTQGLWLTLM